MSIFERAKASIITVGAGRGFVIESGSDRWVITAAHCMLSGQNDQLPPAHGASYLHERTYPNLMAPLGHKPSVWAECVFVDPTIDIAVLCQPDNQELSEKADAYDQLVHTTIPIAISDLPTTNTPKESRSVTAPGWLLSLDGRWFRCTVGHGKDRAGYPASLWLENAEGPIRGGMSGSPILSDSGKAIGIVCTSGGYDLSEAHTSGGPNPRLVHHLPAWLANTYLAR
jgi:hypothetical protein